MQQKTEDIPRINHGINATFLELLSQPGLHWAQCMKQRHVRNRHGAWIRTWGAFRWQTIHNNCTDRAHELRLLTSLKQKAFSTAVVLLVSGENFTPAERRGAGHGGQAVTAQQSALYNTISLFRHDQWVNTMIATQMEMQFSTFISHWGQMSVSGRTYRNKQTNKKCESHVDTKSWDDFYLAIFIIYLVSFFLTGFFCVAQAVMKLTL